jgi:hypothetical protein
MLAKLFVIAGDGAGKGGGATVSGALLSVEDRISGPCRSSDIEGPPFAVETFKVNQRPPTSPSAAVRFEWASRNATSGADHASALGAGSPTRSSAGPFISEIMVKQHHHSAA